MDKLKIVLDWTANTNHTGFYVAQERGFYHGHGIDLEINTPEADDYSKTPAKKVELGEADLALCPFESVLSYNTKKERFDAVAIATIFREDISAITVLQESKINTPKDLDGKVYASYKARYEDEIVKQMIRNDGGMGDIKIEYPKRLGIWDTLINGSLDATWIFTNWEGVHAKTKGIKLRNFKMGDYGIPYGYSPVILASRSRIDSNKKCYKDFLSATKQGFLYAIEHPQYAADCIKPHIAKSDADIDLLESQKLSNKFYGNENNWGIMEPEKVDLFLNWLYDSNLETAGLLYEDLVFSNLLQ
ncbi:ABC transporter substrate-binding protein [Flagellimonas sp. HMM57]|uniref:ABC transporter substrate-binding protein n=1 Tax=unclassified Flagellimonas TaxID=2644544 RepID=UPI0013D0B915|nr:MULTISPECIES: ABC transporter substrate-binding protein [unclassified Flagellimonas]UII74533.1 ABC transporter substrate-binding protein [Flagellimonas sp. HMM57]